MLCRTSYLKNGWRREGRDGALADRAEDPERNSKTKSRIAALDFRGTTLAFSGQNLLRRIPWCRMQSWNT